MNDYYIASDQGPLGPFTIGQLKERHIAPGDMVWCNGMPEWVEASSVNELAEILYDGPTPPVFNRFRYNESHASTPSAHNSDNNSPHANTDNEKCPPTYRWLAILAFLGIVPCAIVAIIKSVMVSRLWEEGNREGARIQSRKTLVWSLISLIIGIPLTIYVMFFSDPSGMSAMNMYQELFNSF